MYGTTIRSYNESKSSKPKNNRIEKPHIIDSKERKMSYKKQQDTKYMKLNVSSNKESYSASEDSNTNDAFSLKDLPIASVVITVILTMMMLVLTSGFGGL